MRPLRGASHLGIQPGLSNAHLVLRRYAQLAEDVSPDTLSDEEEQELLNSPKVGPSQPIDRYICPTARAQIHQQQLAASSHHTVRLGTEQHVWCRDALQALVSPTDALLAMCSSAAYGAKEGVGEHSKKLPAEVELERLASKWGVSTGLPFWICCMCSCVS